MAHLLSIQMLDPGSMSDIQNSLDDFPEGEFTMLTATVPSIAWLCLSLVAVWIVDRA